MGRVAPIDPIDPDADLIAEAAALLRDGKLVAFPTETVYGLGANGLDAQAVKGIYRAKGRPSQNPLILHVSSTAQARELVSNWPEDAEKLANAFWPGPLTIVLPKAAQVPDIVTAGGPTVAIRLPAHPVARLLIEAAGFPLAAPSANRSSEISPTLAEHVAKSLGANVDLILDGGPTNLGIESTVIDLSRPDYRILRFGPLLPSALQSRISGTITRNQNNDLQSAMLPSPGMLQRHYSPLTRLVLLDDFDDLVETFCLMPKTAKYGWLLREWLLNSKGGDNTIRMPMGSVEYAEKLYDSLHRLDVMGFEEIIAEMPPDEEEWLAVRDRLTRAAAE